MQVRFLNTRLDNLTMGEAIEEMDRLIQEGSPSTVYTPNLDHIVTLEKDPVFQEAYEHATMRLADGKPILWISKRLGTPLKEKLSGSDVFPELCALAAEKGYSVFLLGAAEGVAEQAAKNLKRKNKGLKIAGTYSPPFGFEEDEAEIEKIFTRVNGAEPDILAVALGAPKAENFIYQYRDKLKAKLVISVGATIDFEAGHMKRAPKWMTNAGLEWLFRVFQEPRRMLKRYIRDAVSIFPIIRKYKKAQ